IARFPADSSGGIKACGGVPAQGLLVQAAHTRRTNRDRRAGLSKTARHNCPRHQKVLLAVRLYKRRTLRVEKPRLGNKFEVSLLVKEWNECLNPDVCRSD